LSIQIGILDYGIGNLRSLYNALKKIKNNTPIISSNLDLLSTCDKLILPGVGAFPKGIERIRQKGFEQFIKEFQLEGKWTLGICLGMQMLASSSSELGGANGLNLIPGKVKKLPIATSNEIKLPHIRWNTISQYKEHPLLSGCQSTDQYYFIHSFAFQPEHNSDILCTTHYADHEFISGVARDCIVGVQFHPEKSGPVGLSLLQKFTKI
jgi:imidazole glycerol-phosphate synthase subunit HisH